MEKGCHSEAWVGANGRPTHLALAKKFWDSKRVPGQKKRVTPRENLKSIPAEKGQAVLKNAVDVVRGRQGGTVKGGEGTGLEMKGKKNGEGANSKEPQRQNDMK